MIQISIGGMPRDIQYADENWITQQVNKRRELGEPVCVRVTIKTPEIDLVFSSPGCSGRGGGFEPHLRLRQRDCVDICASRLRR